MLPLCRVPNTRENFGEGEVALAAQVPESADEPTAVWWRSPFRGKPRPNGRACGPQYLRSAICVTRSKDPAVPRSDTDHTGPSISPASMPMARSRGLPRAGGSGLWADRPL